MLAYTAGRSNAVRKESSPHAFLIIVAAHVAALAAVMSARMDLPPRFRERPTIVDLINNPPVTPPPAHQPTKPIERQTVLPTEDRKVILPPLPDDSNLVTEDHGSNVVINGGGSGTGTAQELTPSAAVPMHHDARLLTPPSELKPPYPAAKLLTEEEATLTLRLSIDSTGRVVAVEPVGRADRVFVDAARRHLLTHWRYQPATDGDRAVPSSVTITLRFMLDA